jgi:hypothetical protein
MRNQKIDYKRKRDVQILIMIDEKERDKIHKRMNEVGISNRSAYLRKMALNGRIILVRLTEDYRVCGGEQCIRGASLGDKNRFYANISGQKRIRVHDFRHAHVSVLANEGINIQEIARRLGHAKVEITWNTYSHLYPREQEKAVDVLNRIA